MNIWLINHYAVPPKYFPLARQTYFAKLLMEKGHKVTIFAASSVHNSNINLIEDKSLWRRDTVDGVDYVYVKCCDYEGSGLKRVYNMMEFAAKLPKVCRNFEKPDAVVATSMPPVSCAMGIKLAKKYGARAVAEIADLWPASIVAYGVAGNKNLAVQALYWLERWIYTKSDAVIFTMEGGRDYILEKGWDTDHGGRVDMSKVHYINNGVDLEQFDYNREHFTFEDPELEDPNTFKVVFTGSILKTNGIDKIVDTAEVLKNEPGIKFLIFGDGEDRQETENRIKELGLTNIIMKGSVGKNYIPYVLSKADVCLLHWLASPITKYGMSMNKTFEYFASGKPLISNVKPRYDMVETYKCGLSADISSPEEYAQMIKKLRDMPASEYETLCRNSRAAAQEYDFRKLTKRLEEILKNE